MIRPNHQAHFIRGAQHVLVVRVMGKSNEVGAEVQSALQQLTGILVAPRPARVATALPRAG
jgi:hypothetical protein